MSVAKDITQDVLYFKAWWRGDLAVAIVAYSDTANYFCSFSFVYFSWCPKLNIRLTYFRTTLSQQALDEGVVLTTACYLEEEEAFLIPPR